MNNEYRMPNQLFLVEAEAIEEVLRHAVRQALLMHKRAGNPIATWKDNRVVLIPAKQIPVEDDAEFL